VLYVLSDNVDIEYKLDNEEWKPFTGLFITTNGKHTIKFRNKFHYTISDKFSMYSLVEPDSTMSWTVSYSPDTDMIVSFHDYIPQAIFNTNINLISIEQDSIYIHNTNSPGLFYGFLYDSFIDIVFNTPETVTFYNLNWSTDCIDEYNIVKYDNTLSYVSVRNDYLHTSKIYLENYFNVRHIEHTWKFNDMRSYNQLDTNFIRNIYENYEPIESLFYKDKFDYELPRFICDYIIVRFGMENKDKHKIYLNNTQTEFKKSYR